MKELSLISDSVSDSLESFFGRAGSVIVNISHQVGCYVHLAEGRNDDARMFHVLYVSMSRWAGDDVQKLLWLVCAICGLQHMGGENDAISTADVRWFHKDDDVS